MLTQRSVTVGALLALATALPALAQPTSDSPLAPPTNGPKHADPTFHAIVGATIHPRPAQTLENATIVFRDGEILSVGAGQPPEGARVWDATGKHVYPGFIDAFVEVDAPKPTHASPGRHWSPRVTPQRAAIDGAGLSESDKKNLRALGFTAAAIAPKGGVFRGQSALISLGADPSDPSLGEAPVSAPHADPTLGFETSSGSSGDSPPRHRGVMALFRQTLSDAAWQKANDPDAANALTPLYHVDAPLCFDTSHELETLLARRIQRELKTGPVILVGSGSEFRRLEPISAMDASFILPLRFPTKPDVSSIGAADATSLDRLMAWEQAPTNARRLHEDGLTVALTTSKLPKGQKFMANLRKAIETGLSEDAALAMLTTNPAEILGVADTLGALAPGYAANLVLTDAPLFEKDTKILDVWTDGRRHMVNAPERDSLEGAWDLTIDNALSARMEIGKKNKVTIHLSSPGADETSHKASNVSITDQGLSFSVLLPAIAADSAVLFSAVESEGQLVGAMMRPSGVPAPWRAVRARPGADHAAEDDRPFDGQWKVTVGDFEIFLTIEGDEITAREGDAVNKARDVSIDGDRLTLTVVDEDDGTGAYPMSGVLMDDEIVGKGTNPQGESFAWTATRVDDEPEHADIPDPLGAPFGAYNMPRLPERPDAVVISGATVWTCGPDGVLSPEDEDTLVVLKDGKIDYVGPEKSLRFPSGATNVLRIDAEGKHVTPGLIDAHSHTGLFRFGVNESSQAVTSECWIADSLDPGYINWYRQLAGGTTTANLLHGSANPIGGKSQIVKVRWGAPDAETMFMKGAKPGIKFALGENVKQSNWGDSKTTRYPQTRMGVETLMRDRFQAAREYASRGMKTRTGRKNLELEALAEILAGDRLVHCHSYRQDEILMLCRIAEDFGFTIGTFQHGLETYKVAETVREHALGASIFSDWWAYKVEVQDAIPFAGPINHEAGLLTSFNSDDDGLARRMNLEAAKAVKYSSGRVSPEEALKFVTINPAILLGIDDRVGSIEPGKDADVVVWSGDPLSSFSRPEHVFIDGREYFSLELDRTLRARNAAERERIIQKILGDHDSGDDDKHADEEQDNGDIDIHMVDSPPFAFADLDPATISRPGECGCSDAHHQRQFNDR
ncbi:MAG: amidohydrolase family protein [Phycisphaerales bacterium JB059]